MPTRIALLTDIHGNIAALRAALAEIDRQPGVLHRYVLGDQIAIGPYVDEVLELLFSRPDISQLRGNHEDAVLAILAGTVLPGHEAVRSHHEWVARRLDPAFVPRIAALPHAISLVFEGVPVLLHHYHQHSPGAYSAIDPAPTAAALDERYAGCPVRVVGFGHHHPLHDFRSPARIYLNPGSLGCCDRPVARYALLTFDQGQVDVELCEATYDNTEFLAAFDRLAVPDRDFLRSRLIPGGGGRLTNT